MDSPPQITVVDSRMQYFIQQESQKARAQKIILELTEKCWDACFDGKPGNEMDSRTENCLNNCVDRFIDTNLSMAKTLKKKEVYLDLGAGFEARVEFT